MSIFIPIMSALIVVTIFEAVIGNNLRKVPGLGCIFGILCSSFDLVLFVVSLYIVCHA